MATDAEAEPFSAAARLFAVCWAVAAIVDLLVVPMWRDGGATAGLLALGVAMAAISVVMRPGSTVRLAVLAALWATDTFHHAPFVPNHAVLSWAINMTIASSCVCVLIQRRLRAAWTSADSSEAYRLFAPIVKVELVAVYWLAALHKLNRDYVDLDTSCGAAFVRDISARFHLPTGVVGDVAGAWGSLALEIGIPVLLLFRRTRIAGVIAALSFHLLLTLHPIAGIVGFCAIACAGVSVFAPADAIAMALRRARPRGRWAAAAVVVAAGCVALAFASALPRWTHLAPGWLSWRGQLPQIAGRTIWFAFAAVAAYAIARAPRSPRSLRPALVPARQARWPLLVFPALLVVNGLGPYLGYKTIATFGMFSNLRTEGGATNHLLLPPAPPDSLENDLIEIADSSSPRLRSFGRHGVRVSYFELRRLLGGRDSVPDSVIAQSSRAAPGFRALANEVMAEEFWVVYVRNGRTIRASRRSDPGAEVFRPPPWLLSKLIGFHQVGRSPGRCVLVTGQ